MKLLSSPNDRGIVAVHEHGLDVYPAPRLSHQPANHWGR